jgi:hypothetical protein
MMDDGTFMDRLGDLELLERQAERLYRDEAQGAQSERYYEASLSYCQRADDSFREIEAEGSGDQLRILVDRHHDGISGVLLDGFDEDQGRDAGAVNEERPGAKREREQEMRRPARDERAERDDRSK